jgi:DNA topoisomerase-2
MVLVNGAAGIGTGFSTKIPPYDPLAIIKNIRNIINGTQFESMDPWWQNFEGMIYKIDDFNYEIYGSWSIDDNKLTITELPVGEWTSNYKEFLEKMLGNADDKKNKKKNKENPFLSYKDNNTDSKVQFELFFEDGYLESVKDIDKLYHLYKKYSITNMHLYGPSGHIKRYNTVEDIMRDYYQVRLQLYISRKKHQLDIIKHQLELISSKVKFISMVVKKQLKINDVPRLEIEEELIKHKFKQMSISKDNTKVSYDYLLSMPIYNLTSEKIIELNKQHKDKEEEYEQLNSKTPEDIWLSELDILEDEYTKWYNNKIKEAKPKSSKKKSKKNKN